MLEKLKSLIQSEVESIEVERHRVENDRLQKELADQQEQCKDEYHGRNKLKILLINFFKYKNTDEISYLFAFFLCLMMSILTPLLMVDIANNPKMFPPNESNLILSVFHFFFFSLFTILFILLSILGWKSLTGKTIAQQKSEEIKLKIETENEESNEKINNIKKIFSGKSDYYKNYINITVSKNVFDEAVNVLKEQTFKQALYLSGGDNMKHGYLINAIINQEESEKLNEVYGKLKNI